MKKVLLLCLSLIAAYNLAGEFVSPEEAVSIGCGIFEAMTEEEVK